MQFNLKTPAVKNFAILFGRTMFLMAVFFVLTMGASFNSAQAFVPVCGDGVCDTGEASYCYADGLGDACLTSDDCGVCGGGGGGGGGATCTDAGYCVAFSFGTDSCTPGSLCVWDPDTAGTRCDGGVCVPDTFNSHNCDIGSPCTNTTGFECVVNACQANINGTATDCLSIGDSCVPTSGGLGCRADQTCGYGSVVYGPCNLIGSDQCLRGCNASGQCTTNYSGGPVGASCTTNSDCPPPSLTTYCSAGSCVSGIMPIGATPCASITDCGGSYIGTYCNTSGACVMGGTTNNCTIGSCSPVIIPPAPTCNIHQKCAPYGGGASCDSDSDCLDPPTCNGYNQCVPGGGGISCASDAGCWAPPTCNSNLKCVSGGGGVPCANDGGCQQPLGCNSAEQCVPGGTQGTCTANTQCVPVRIPHCAGLVCTDALNTGTPCSTYAECLPPAGCNSIQQCVYGGTQGICGSNYNCIPPLGCNSTQQCIPGGTQGNCYTNTDCQKPLGCNATTKKCVPGGTDGNCTLNKDCLDPVGCDPYNKCVPGGTGGNCVKNEDCQVTRCTQYPTSSEPYQCIPYTVGGLATGRFCSLNSSDPDKVCQPPPKPGNLVIQKVTRGGNASFQFFVNPMPFAFPLSGGTSQSLKVEPGTKEDPIRYNIAEVLPDHWNFVGAFCDRSFILTTNSVEEVSVESEETTTCTFYNEKNGYIKIINQNDSFATAGEETAEYAILPSPIYETITSGAAPGVGIEHELKPATYAILQNTPLDWQITSVECNGVPTAVVNSIITTKVDPGATTTCIFKNKIKAGNLIINKYTEGGDDKFYFDINRIGSGGGTREKKDITTVNGRKDLNLTIAPGTYNISEIVTDGWELSRFNCTNTTYDSSDNGPTNIIIADTKTTICNFYNIKKGYLKILKETQNGDDTFKYKIENYNPSQNSGAPKTETATITTVNKKGNTDLLPLDQGSYNITEEIPEGWQFDSVSCDGSYTYGQNGAMDVRVTNGKTTTCTFKNTKKGKANLKIVKETSGGNGTFNYAIDFVSPGSGTAPLIATATVKTTDGSGDSGILAENQDTYNITETVPTGWKLSSVSCVKEDGSSVGTASLTTNSIRSVSLVDNTTVTCTFKNAKDKLKGNLKIIKETDGQKNASEDFYFNIDLTSVGETTDSALTKTASVTASKIGAKTIGRGESALLEEIQGTYSIAENPDRMPEGWSFKGANCDHAFITALNGVVNVAVVAGETTTCTFRNSKNGTLVIKKKTGQDGDGLFKFSIDPTPSIVNIKTKNGNGTNDGNCPDGTAVSSSGTCPNGDNPNSKVLEIASGVYNITEIPATGWVASSLECKTEDGKSTGLPNNGNNSVQKITINAGQATTCTFNNAKTKTGSGGGSGGSGGNVEERIQLEENISPY